MSSSSLSVNSFVVFAIDLFDLICASSSSSDDDDDDKALLDSLELFRFRRAATGIFLKVKQEIKLMLYEN